MLSMKTINVLDNNKKEFPTHFIKVFRKMFAFSHIKRSKYQFEKGAT